MSPGNFVPLGSPTPTGNWNRKNALRLVRPVLNPAVNGTLTQTQYRIMQARAEGEFEDDWSGGPPPLSFQIGPEGLDRAALEAWVGSAFYPGIEVSRKMRDVFGYAEPFRLDHDSLVPGDVTQQMSLPWQTDYIDCAYEEPYVWWPASVRSMSRTKKIRPTRLGQGPSISSKMPTTIWRQKRWSMIFSAWATCCDRAILMSRWTCDAPPMEVFNKRNFKNGRYFI